MQILFNESLRHCDAHCVNHEMHAHNIFLVDGDVEREYFAGVE
jgi:hypothetical protein